MSEYFPKPKYVVANVKVELDFKSKFKANFKNATGVDTSAFDRKNDLAILNQM